MVFIVSDTPEEVYDGCSPNRIVSLSKTPINDLDEFPRPLYPLVCECPTNP